MTGLDSGFVVVGFDGTPESTAALRWALGRAAGMQAALKVVHCWPAGAIAAQRDTRTALGNRVDAVCAVENELAAARALVPQPPQVALVFSASTVGPLLLAQTRRAAMLVLGASSAGVLSDPSCGPVAGPCLNRIACPVVVVDRRGRVATAQPRYPALGLAG
jgi:nucleotide-binding universal stress UspA family protein